MNTMICLFQYIFLTEKSSLCTKLCREIFLLRPIEFSYTTLLDPRYHESHKAHANILPQYSLNLVQQITQERFAPEASNLVGNYSLPIDIQGSRSKVKAILIYMGEHRCFTNISCFI